MPNAMEGKLSSTSLFFWQTLSLKDENILGTNQNNLGFIDSI